MVLLLQLAKGLVSTEDAALGFRESVAPRWRRRGQGCEAFPLRWTCGIDWTWQLAAIGRRADIVRGSLRESDTEVAAFHRWSWIVYK
jgi:hypothetical protein